MAARFIDGNALAERILQETRGHAARLREKGRPVRLVALKANDDRGSESYAAMQKRHCEANGLEFRLDALPADASHEAILGRIEAHNADPATHAMMLHRPLPAGVDGHLLSLALDPLKDAEGMHPANLGSLFFDPEHAPAPCTAVGAVLLASEAVGSLRGRDVLVIGHSRIVGRPAALLLMAHDATVQVAHIHTRNLGERCRRAEVLVVATGASRLRYEEFLRAREAFRAGQGPRPEVPDLSPLVGAEVIRPGAAVIDIGVNRIPAGFDAEGGELRDPRTGGVRYMTAGDVDHPAASAVADWITPEKGGAGPVTNALLLRNAVRAALLQT